MRTDRNCAFREAEEGVRVGFFSPLPPARTGVADYAAALWSELRHRGDVRVAPQRCDVAPQVVDVEGRTLKLTGTAEEQYREWRKLLHELYLEENGLEGPRLPEDLSPAAPMQQS